MTHRRKCEQSLVRGLLRGAFAGAAGTTALNTVTYLDMVLRGRPESGAPAETVEALAERTGLTVPGEDEERWNRVTGLGALTGVGAGVGIGALLGLANAAGLRPGAVVATAAALAGTNGPMTALGVTDPRTWPATDWVADVLPHLAYGVVVASVLNRPDQVRSSR